VPLRGPVEQIEVVRLDERLDFVDTGLTVGELLRWVETYGDPEQWAKRAQAAHARAEALAAHKLAKASTAVGSFTDLGDAGPVRFQGGIIVLQGNGCSGCGNGFWTEADRARRLTTGAVHHCPHCGQRREVTS
jgi:hypothetical protein